MHSLTARLASRPVWLLAALGILLNLSGTWTLPLIDRDEPRFAEASREMLERGDWVVPWFNGTPRYDKPPLIYWAQMVCYRLLGENELAARLPAALFTTGTALLIFFWARRLIQPRAALVAAILFLTCLQTGIHGRLAVADMPMIFFTCAACWSGWEMSRPAGPFPWRWWWMFHASLGLGFLAKGPVAWLPIAGLILGRWLRPAEFDLKPGRLALGMLLTLGMVAAWGIPALRETHGEFWNVGMGYHVIHRSFGVLDGHGASGTLGWIASAPFSVATFFISFFPWAWRVPRTLRNWWPRRQNDAFAWYLLAQAAVVFAVFTIVRTKLLHYTLPAFPCLAIWLAKMEQEGMAGNLQAPKFALRMAVLIFTAPLLLGVFAGPLFAGTALFEKARPQLQPGMAVANVMYTEPSLVWEFRKVVTNEVVTLDPAQALLFLRRTNPAVVIMPTSLYETNQAFHADGYAVVQVKGINFVKFEPIALTAVIHR